MLTVLLHSVDEQSPIVERLPAAAAERLYAATRDHRELWPAVVSAVLVGDDDVLDRW
jgi:hypothetical protein